MEHEYLKIVETIGTNISNKYSKFRIIKSLLLLSNLKQDKQRMIEDVIQMGIWNRAMEAEVYDPFLFGSLIIEHWKLSQKLGWHPFLMIFLSEKKIIGFAPLLMRSRFGFRYVSNFDQYTCPEFFSKKYREVCIDQIVKYLFRNLNCETANLTFWDESPDQRILEKVCRNQNLTYTRVPQEGQAIIPVKTDLDYFKKSLNRKDVKEFQRIGRKLDKLGSWCISCLNLSSDSLAKIWEIEQHSWKAGLKGKEKAKKDLGLTSILNGVERSKKGPSFFESEVCFLNLNSKPIAYVLIMYRKKTVLFAKTSFDARFKEVSPGIFLMNALIEKVFRSKKADKIDFISNLPCVRIWKPLIVKRVTFGIQQNVFLSKARSFVFDNPIRLRASKIFERLVWEKRRTK
jgi:hypothetical protein